MTDRFEGLTIDTLAELTEQIDYVLQHPDIAGFDCMLSRQVLADPGSKAAAMGYGMRGVRVHLQVHEERSTPTHVAVRLVVTPPLKVKA